MDHLNTVLVKHGIDVTTLDELDGFSDDSVYRLITHGREGVGLWRKLRAIVDQSGYWPAILGDEDSVTLLRECAAYQPSAPAEIIETAEAMVPAEWFASQRNHRSRIAEKLAESGLPDFMRDVYRRLLQEMEAQSRALPPAVNEPWPGKCLHLGVHTKAPDHVACRRSWPVDDSYNWPLDDFCQRKGGRAEL